MGFRHQVQYCFSPNVYRRSAAAAPAAHRIYIRPGGKIFVARHLNQSWTVGPWPTLTNDEGEKDAINEFCQLYSITQTN